MARSILHDDRGRRAGLCSPSAMPSTAPAPAGRAHARATLLHSRVVRGFFMGTVIGVFTLPVLLAVTMSGNPVTALTGIPFLIGTTAVCMMGIGSLARRQTERARGACLLVPLCPACGYALEGLSEQADGCRVCPECGCAWRLRG